MSDQNDVVLLRVVLRKETDGTTVTFRYGDSSDDISEYSTEISPQEWVGKSLRSISDDWTNFCISFFKAVPMLSGFGFELASGSLTEDFAAFLKENSISHEEREVEEDVVEQSFVVHEDDAIIVLKEHGKSWRILRAARAMQSATLGALISEYESFIERLLRTVSTIVPEPFLAGLSALDPKDVFSLDDIDDLKEGLRARGVEAALRNKSHLEVLSWISSRLGVETELPSELHKDFVEICQRRHLLTHNGGRVNQRYLDLCVNAGWRLDELQGRDEKVTVEPQYLQRATARVFQVALFTLHMIWQKHLPRDCQASYGTLLSASHDFLEEGLTKMARRVIAFARHSEKRFDNRLKMYFRINEALSYLYEPKMTQEEQMRKVIEVLNAGDWSVTTPTVDLALACARREFDNVLELAKRARDDGLGYNEARTFVVFREARKIDGFLECFPKRRLELAAPS